MHVTLAAVLLVVVRTVLGADSNPDGKCLSFPKPTAQ